MILALVIWGTVAVCTANPLHKYPYVFLLDVGNEELQQTKTEQLRVSIPGGSLAMKYPAMGEGDPISHVRVSGIDFGTDLKVNIVEGGPGYKYVVLMFMGNPGVSYDAVVTLQTQQIIPRGTEINLTSTNRIATTENYPYEVSEAESVDDDQDLINDPKNIKQYSKKSKEVMQSSSTFYNYAKKEIGDSDEDKETENVSAEEQDVNNENDSEDEDDEKGNDFSNNGNQRFFNEHKYESSHQNGRKNSDEDETENDENEEDRNENNDNIETKLYREPNFDQFSEVPRAEKYRYNVNLNNDDNAKPDDEYDKYTKPQYGLGFRVYPQSFIYNRQYRGNSGYNKEDPTEFGQMFNNEVVPDNNRFKDGSNSIDPDYLVAEY